MGMFSRARLPRPVSEIVADFADTVRELEETASDARYRVVECAESIAALETERASLAAEAARAERIAQKIESLTS